MADIPGVINYGQVVGRFVSFLADSGDSLSVPDEVPLNGTVTLTPRVSVLQIAGATPPRMALAQALSCPVVDGWLCPPGSSTPGVWVIATDQPAAEPNTVQWQADFSFPGNISPGSVIFNVPTSGTVDISLAVPISPAPGTVTVVSHEDALAAAASAAEAADIVSSRVAKGELVINVADHGSLQDGLTAAAGKTAFIPPGSYSVSATLTVPDNTLVSAAGATITTTTSNLALLQPGNGVTIRGLTLVGKGTDYVSGGSPTAFGIDVNAKTGVSVQDVSLSNFAGAAVRVNAATDTSINGAKITGTGTVAANDGTQYGILVESTSTRTSISDTVITGTAQGVIGSRFATHLSMVNVKIHDIPGQHGVYLQNAYGLHIHGLDVWNTNLNGLKVQIYSGNTADAIGMSISGVTADNCGDSGVIIYNSEANLTSAYRYRAVALSGIVVTNSVRGIYLGSIRGGVVNGLSVYNCTGDGIALIDCCDIEGSSWVVDTVTKVGLRFALATGSTTDRVSLSGVRIHNPAGGNDGTNIDAVDHGQGSNVSIDRLTVTATNGFLRYGYFLSSSSDTDQQTFALRNADLSGSTVSARFRTSLTNVKAWAGNKFAGTITNKPAASDALTPLVATPAPGAQNGLAASFDPVIAGNNLTVLTAGVLFLVKVQIPDGGPIGTVWFATGAAGASLTSGQNFVGVYTAAASGALLGSTADQTALSFASAGGLKSVALTSATASQLSGASVYLAFLFNGTTGPTLRGITGSAIAANANLSVPRFATAGTGLTTLPSTLPSLTAVLTPVWAALS